jgi:hypothetical protein
MKTGAPRDDSHQAYWAKLESLTAESWTRDG